MVIRTVIQSVIKTASMKLDTGQTQMPKKTTNNAWLIKIAALDLLLKLNPPI